MKSILMSIKPKWVAKILNGEKTIEIRKKFPKDYVGWVYIYCTKEDNLMKLSNFRSDKFVSGKEYDITDFVYLNSGYEGKGKVVARFWCDKVEEIFAKPDRYKEFYFYDTDKLDMEDLLKQSCLDYNELDNYLDANNGYAIHIDKIEIFDKPKELNNFLIYSHSVSGIGFKGEEKQFKILKPLNRAPESYCYVEI